MNQTVRVFIADSSIETVALLRDLLTQTGDIEIAGTACRGDEALRAFPESGAEVLLCDLLLPVLDGLGLLRQLHDAGRLPHAIVLSGFFNDRVARAVSLVADNYLLKPCSASELVRCIRECVRPAGRGFSPGVRTAVRRALTEVCVPPHLDGCRYLQSALERTLSDPRLLRGVTKSLYRDIAKEHGTTPECVERSIRSAIDRAWSLMSDAVRVRYFGAKAAGEGRPISNVPFLTAMTLALDSRADALDLGGEP